MSSAGRYALTFTATSSDGQTATASVSVQVGEIDEFLPMSFTATGTLNLVLQSEYGARTRMSYDAPVEFEIQLLDDGTTTVVATWTAQTYYIECLGGYDHPDRSVRGEVRLIGSKSITLTFSGNHADGVFSLDLFDVGNAEDVVVSVSGDGGYTSDSLTGSFGMSLTSHASADPEGDWCGPLTNSYDFQITSATRVPASEQPG